MTTTNFYKQKVTKDKIVLHHTAGSHQPHWVIDGWEANKRKVGTPWVIGGMANPPYKNEFDGTVVKYFDDEYWAHHLGIVERGYFITKSSIGIETCNYGGLIKNKYGQYLTYVGSLVPEDQVAECDFRGYKYYEAYTELQLISLRMLLLDIASRHNIDLHLGLYALIKAGKKAFEKQSSALAGKPGLWSHGSYRSDKTDCSPQEALIEMILSL